MHSAIALTGNTCSRRNLDYFSTFLYSVILTEYVRMDIDCMFVCVSVCLCVCATALQPKWLGFPLGERGGRVGDCREGTKRGQSPYPLPPNPPPPSAYKILIIFHTSGLQDMGQCRFSQVLDISIWWRHGGHFAFFVCGTLTVVISIRLCSNMWKCCSQSQPSVRYRKSAKSVSNFRTVRTIITFFAQNRRQKSQFPT